jgi:aryl-alcohol dehydrogenase-like predicted oxidoreductase
VLAGGALSGSAKRHTNAAGTVDPIASGKSFDEDVALSRRFSFLVNEGYAGSLIEAAIRFVIGKSGVSTAVIGISTVEQLDQAVESANKGPLPAEAIERLNALWADLGSKLARE